LFASIPNDSSLTSLVNAIWNIGKKKYEKGFHRTDTLPSYRKQKVKNPDYVADSLNNFFVLFTENLNLHQAVKEDDTVFLAQSVTCSFPGLKIPPATEPKTKI
jgi:hypothetical protein